jgi:hypothetical protein
MEEAYQKAVSRQLSAIAKWLTDALDASLAMADS